MVSVATLHPVCCCVFGVYFGGFLQDKQDGKQCDEIVTEVVLRYRY